VVDAYFFLRGVPVREPIVYGRDVSGNFLCAREHGLPRISTTNLRKRLDHAGDPPDPLPQVGECCTQLLLTVYVAFGYAFRLAVIHGNMVTLRARTPEVLAPERRAYSHTERVVTRGQVP